jgi:PAS domain S-box-containing protein
MVVGTVDGTVHWPFALLTAAGVVVVCAVALLIYVIQNKRSEGKRLQALIDERTKALEAQTSVFKAVFSSIPDIMYCKDMDRKFTQCSASMGTLYGLPVSDIIGKTEEEGLGILQEKAAVDFDSDSRVLNDGVTVTAEETIRAADGRDVICETIKFPMMQEDGTIVGLVGISRDITRRKLHEEAAKAAARESSEKMASITQDVRAPMKAIVGMTAVGKSVPDEKRMKYCFSKIEEAAVQLLGVLGGAADSSEVKPGKVELTPVDFNFRRMLQNAVGVVSFLINEKKQSLSVNVDDAIPQNLFGDDQRLAQVVSNLMSNAVKFTPDGGSIGVDANLVSAENDTYTIEIAVTDSGVGLSPAQQAQLFKPPPKAAGDAAQKDGGQGFGLLIAKSIVDMMQGSIGVESEPGKGSVFYFTVGLRRSDGRARGQGGVEGGEVAQVILAADGDWGLPPDSDGIFNGFTVLMAEEDGGMRDVIAALLEPTLLALDGAVGGEDAVAMFGDNPDGYAMVFLDADMTEMNIYEATRQIRAVKNPKAKTIPIIAMITDPTQDNIDRCLGAGMNGYIGKPPNQAELFDLLKRSLIGDSGGKPDGKQNAGGSGKARIGKK